MNTGCIPTKALVRAAEVFHAARIATRFGARSAAVDVDFAAVMARKDRLVRDVVERMERNLGRSAQMEIVRGAARFRSSTEIQIGDRVLTAPKMVVAVGSRPRIPPIPGLDGGRYVTSDGIMDLKELPGRFAVIGGGAVACEFAQMFARFGSQVTMLVRGERLIPREDAESAAVLADVFLEEGIRLELGAAIERVEQTDGAERLHVRRAEELLTVDADLILVATGRVPNVDGLELERAGIRHGPDGVVVDRQMRTTAPNVWAAGDCTGGLMFTHVAVHEGGVAGVNAAGQTYEADETFAPRAIFCDPEVAGFGLSEEEALAKRRPVKIGRQPLTNVGRARVMEETRGFIKFVLDAEDDRILGCHVVAPHGAEVIHAALVAAHAGAKLDPILAAIFIHPTLAEGLQSAAEATYVAVPRLTH